MSFSAGDTFINKPVPHAPTHLWVVISDMNQSVDEIVIVNLTTYKDNGDNTCLLDKGDHPFVKHQTCISYRDARIVSLSKLNELENKEMITRQEALKDNILERVRAGAVGSLFTPLKILKILEDQNLA